MNTPAMLRNCVLGLLAGAVAACAVLGWVTSNLAAKTEAKPRTLRVILDSNYPPYSFRSDDGVLQGILIDQWRAWEKKTGFEAELHALDWAEALQRMRAGEFDVIDCIVETDARREYFDFTPSSAAIEVPISFGKNISGITDLASLKGFPVGVKAGDQHIDLLRAAGVTTLVEFPNDAAVIAAAKQHKINVFVLDAPSALYHLNKAGIEDDFRQSAPIFRDDLRRAVRKGDAATLRVAVEGFAALKPGELKRIDEKWFGRTINRNGRYLVYAGYAGAVAVLVLAGLVTWTRTLRNKIHQRTTELRESEQRFRQIAENINDVFWLTTRDSRQTLYISPAFEAIWGLPRDRLYQDQTCFLAAVHPEDRPRVVSAMNGDGGRGFQVEYRVVKPDGAIRWIWDRGFPIKDEAGHVYRIARIAEDITERKAASELVKQAESRTRLVIDTIPTSAWSIRPDGALDFMNQQWLDYTGRSLAEELADPTGRMHPDELPGIMEKWSADMAAGRPFGGEMRLRRADGVYRWFLVRTVPLRDEQGSIVKWFGASIDIQDRKEAEESLQNRKQQLRALVGRLHIAREEEAKRIARELHDDLGQHLTALKLELDNLELKLADAPPAQRAQIVKMHSLVNHTIEVVQSIAGGLRLGQLDVLGLTAAIEWQLQEFSRRSSIPVEIVRLDEITNLSEARNTAVFRILQEALTNIVRHAGATRVEVSLQAETQRVTLRVRDNGRGISAPQISDRKAIGLLGMRERAEMLGGTVTLTGAAGEGTTVLVTIPMEPAGRISA